MEPTKVLDLIRKPPTEEILTEEKLTEYLTQNKKLVHYIGFEISGLVHIGNGIVCMQKVADFQKAGINTNIFLADYHSWINKKLGSDLDLIKKVAGGYFKEAIKYSLLCVGGDPNKVNFILASEFYEKMGIKYMENVLKISKKMTLSKAKKSMTIMGRKSTDLADLAQLIYTPMQVADIFSLGVNIAHGGMDQRKAHVIAIEIGEEEFGYKPIAVHNHVLLGVNIDKNNREKIIRAKKCNERELLNETFVEIKMSKSKPESAIFIHDTEEKIEEKIKKAYCPPRELEINPIIDIQHYVIWPYIAGKGETFEIVNIRKGGRKIYEDFRDLEKDYLMGEIHPEDLKQAVIKYLTEILAPARKYFLEGTGRKYLEEMREIMSRMR